MSRIVKNGSGDGEIADEVEGVSFGGESFGDPSDFALLRECGAFFKVLSSLNEAAIAGLGEQVEDEDDASLSERWPRVVIAIAKARAATIEGLERKIAVVKEFLDSVAGEELAGGLLRSVCEDVESLIAGQLRRTGSQSGL